MRVRSGDQFGWEWRVSPKVTCTAGPQKGPVTQIFALSSLKSGPPRPLVNTNGPFGPGARIVATAVAASVPRAATTTEQTSVQRAMRAKIHPLVPQRNLGRNLGAGARLVGTKSPPGSRRS